MVQNGVSNPSRCFAFLEYVLACDEIMSRKFRFIESSTDLHCSRLPESIVGDITPYDGVSKVDKKKMESEAMKNIAPNLMNYGKNMKINPQKKQSLSRGWIS